ncbi:hypothetical protein MTO96_033250 [Rhipicephalus appendiculatus]
MEVVVEGQTITEDEYLSGSWTTLEAQRWCARQQPRTDTKQTGSTTADSEHRERGRPRFRARPPPLPKRKPLPKLPPADYKIIIRPQTAASLLHYGATELFKAVCAAAQVNPVEVVAEDQLRLHPTNNTALISTPNCKFKYYSQVQQHNNNSKNGTGTKATTVVIAQQQGSDQENRTRITSATQPNSQSTGYRDAVRDTPLTEASQARQDNATLLQQAPSGSREHSSSRGRAAAHGHYTSHGHGTSQGQGAQKTIISC